MSAAESSTCREWLCDRLKNYGRRGRNHNCIHTEPNATGPTQECNMRKSIGAVLTMLLFITGATLSGLPGNAAGQAVSARLEGMVQDQTQAVIPGVGVVATNT